MSIEQLDQEIIAIVHWMALEKINGSMCPANLEVEFTTKIDRMAHLIRTKGARNFWAILNRLIAHNKITHDVEYHINEDQPTFELRLMDVYDKYVECIQEYMPNEPVMELGTLYNILKNEGNYIKRHKPFFGGSLRWAIQFYSDPDFIMLKSN